MMPVSSCSLTVGTPSCREIAISRAVPHRCVPIDDESEAQHYTGPTNGGPGQGNTPKTLGGTMTAFSSLVLALSILSAPQISKVKVSVSHWGDDSVGTTLALAVREAVRQSVGYELATAKNALFDIKLVSVDHSTKDEGVASAIAVIYTVANLAFYEAKNPQTWLPLFMDAHVLYLGRKRAQDQGTEILAMLDAKIAEYKALQVP